MPKILGVSMLSLILILASCGPLSNSQLSGSEEKPSVSVDEIPDEPSQSELREKLESASDTEIEALISNNFHLLDVVSGDDGNANVYATRQFTREELVSLITEINSPDEKSEVKDNQQMLIYPNHFVTFKTSEEDNEVLLIEVASDQFVRSNYSPNYLNGFFTFLLINRMLGTSSWERSRMDQCKNSSCYGGYTTQNRGGLNTNRGMSSYRGGGSSSGK